MQKILIGLFIAISIALTTQPMEKQIKRKQPQQSQKNKKRRKQELQNTPWHTLPLEIQEYVMSLVAQEKKPLESFDILNNAKLVCKNFKQIAQLPHVLKSVTNLIMAEDLATAQAIFLRAASTGDYAIVESMLNAGIDIESKNSRGQTALSIALMRHHQTIAELLISRKANIMHCDATGNSVLHYASAHNNSTLTSSILSCYKENDLFTFRMFNPRVAAENYYFSDLCLTPIILGNTARVKQLLSDPITAAKMRTVTDRAGHLALQYASINGTIEIVNLLLQNATDVTRKTLANCLFYAIIHGHEKLAELLISYGADVNHVFEHDFTPLTVAANAGQPRIIELLMTQNVPLEGINADGLTALLTATCHGHKECVKILLAAGADVHAKSNKGWTALMYASFFGYYNIACLLIQHGATINACNNNGHSVLNLAVQSGRTDIVQLLLNMGAEVDLREQNAMTPLMVAASLGCREITEILMRYNPDFHITHSGQTILPVAIFIQSKDHFKTVKQAEVIINATHGNALAIAASGGKKNIVELLIDHYDTNDWHTAAQLAQAKQYHDIYLLLSNHEEELASSWMNEDAMGNL